MPFPHLRLYGVQELSARHIRDAKILLAKVKDLRARMGVPIYQLERRFPDLILIAQSYGVVDIITAIATAGGTTSAQEKVDVGLVGIVFKHAGTRASVPFLQGIVADCMASGTLGNYQVVDAPWNGRAERNAQNLHVTGAPATLDERRLISAVHSITFNHKYNVHVEVQQYQGNADGFGSTYSRVMVGGVEMLFAGDISNFVGAQLYDDGTLGLAYVDAAGTRLRVETRDLGALAYQTEFNQSTDPTPLSALLVDDAGGENTIFNFHPARLEGSWLSSRHHSSAGIFKLDYQMGHFVPDGGDPAGGFTTELSANDVVLSATASNGLTGSEVVGTQTRTVVCTAAVPAPDGVTTSTGTATWEVTWEGSFTSATLSASCSVSISSVPVWTGYTRAGERVRWLVSGSAFDGIAGAHTGSWTSGTATITSSITFPGGVAALYQYTDVSQTPATVSGSVTLPVHTLTKTSTCSMQQEVTPGSWAEYAVETLDDYSAITSDGSNSTAVGDNVYATLIALGVGDRYLRVVQGTGDYPALVTPCLGYGPIICTGFAPGTAANAGAGNADISLTASPYDYDLVTLGSNIIFQAGTQLAPHAAAGSTGLPDTPAYLRVSAERGGTAIIVGGGTTYDPGDYLYPMPAQSIKYNTDLSGYAATGSPRLVDDDGSDPISSSTNTFTDNIMAAKGIGAACDLRNCVTAPLTNRLRYASLYVAPLDKHVVTPRAIFVSDLTQTAMGALGNHVHLLGVGAEDITAAITGTTKAAADGSGIVPPVIPNTIANSDLVAARGAY